MKKQYRIKRNEEFGSIIEQRHTVGNSSYRLFFVPKKEVYSRVGLSVSKKLGNSPERNKIKRQIRMMFIENYNFEKMPNDLIVIVKNGYLDKTFEENKNDLEKLIKKAII